MRSTDRLLMALVILGGLALVAATGYYLLKGGAGDAPPEVTEPGAPEGNRTVRGGDALDPDEVDGVGPDARTRIAPEGVAPEDRDPLAGAEHILTGHLTDDGGRPVAGARVGYGVDLLMGTGVSLTGNAPTLEGIELPETLTDRQGAFRIEGTPGKPGVALMASHADYVPRVIPLDGYEGGMRDLGVFALKPGARATGRAKDTTGRLLAGITIQARPATSSGKPEKAIMMGREEEAGWSVVTDDSGSFALSGLPAGKVSILGTHPDYITGVIEPFEVVPGRPAHGLEVVMDPGESISGQVVDGSGNPVNGAGVTVDRTLHIDLSDADRDLSALYADNHAVTDEDGIFRLQGLRQGEYTVRARAEGFAGASAEEVETGRTGLVLVLERGGWIAGWVRDARSGKAPDRFDVKVERLTSTSIRPVVRKDASDLESDPRFADKEGAFLVESLPTGTFDIVVSAPGYGEQRIEELEVRPGDGRELSVELWPESVVAGRVIGPDGEGVEAARVSVRKASERPGGRRMLRFSMSEDGATVEDASLVKTGESGPDGLFRITGMPAGRFEVTASHDGFAESQGQVLDLEEGARSEDLTLRLLAAGAVAGMVYDADGVPRPGARVQASRVGDPAGGMLDSKTATADGEGAYRLGGLIPGEYDVRLEGTGGFRVMGGAVSISMGGEGAPDPGVHRVEVFEGQVTELDLRERSKGAITGTAREVGEGVAGLQVSLFVEGGGGLNFMPVKTDVTDDEGTYAFEELEPGDYRVSMASPGLGEPVDRNTTVEEGGEKTVDFDLPSGRVSGRILDALTGKPAAGVRVSLSRDSSGTPGSGGQRTSRTMVVSMVSSSTVGGVGGGGRQTISMTGGGAKPVITDDEGRYLIRHVSDGDYKLTATGGGFSKGELPGVKVKEGQETKNSDLELGRGLDAAGRVIDKATGKPTSVMIPLTCFKLVKGAPSGRPQMVSVQDSGAFRIEDQSPGVYRLSPPQGLGYSGSLDFTLNDHDLEDLELVIEKSQG